MTIKKIFFCDDCDTYLHNMHKANTVEEGKEVLEKHNLVCVPLLDY